MKFSEFSHIARNILEVDLPTAAPIQPHMGDFMIGFPAGVENTIHALNAGVTAIGNLSKFFAHEVPILFLKIA